MKRTQYQLSNRRGFTIIEVVLVLAIAGLIFLMVFIALPNMQSAQRNTQRRNDYNSLATQVTNYAANHNGSLVGSSTLLTNSTDYGEWFNANGKDPDGSDNKLSTLSAVPATMPTISRNGDSGPQAFIIYAAKCNEGVPTTATGSKNFVIYGYVEDGANKDGTYCLESHA